MQSVLNLFNRTEIQMTETKTLLENWDRKDIKFKELIDFGFPVPRYVFEGEQVYSVE